MIGRDVASAAAWRLIRSASASMPNPVAEVLSISRRLVTGVNWLQLCEAWVMAALFWIRS